MASRAFAIGTIGGLALTIASVGSAFPSSRLVYIRSPGAEACTDEPGLRRAVAARLGYDPFFPSAGKTIVAQINREGKELRSTVQLIDERGFSKGLRQLKSSADQCEELVAMVALAISIAIDPTVDANETKRDTPEVRADLGGSAVPPNPPAPSPPGQAVPKLTTSPAGPIPEWQWFSGVLAGGSLGTSPALAWNLGAMLGVRRGNLSLSLEGRRQFPASSSLAGGGAIGTSAWMGTLAPCAGIGLAFICSVGSLGRLEGQGASIALPRSGAVVVASVGGRVGAEVPLTDHIRLRSQVDVVANLTRASLLIDQSKVWEEPSAAGMVAVGVVARFP